MPLPFVAIAAAAASLTTPAFSTPHDPADLCLASAPAVGAAVEGTVLHVADEYTVCLAQGPTPEDWIPLIVEGPSPVDRHDPMLSKAAMMRAVFAKRLSCVVTSKDAQGAHARCSIEQKPVGLVVASVSRGEAAAWLPHS